MAEVKGLGKCPLCMEDLNDAKTGVSAPIRHWRGHQLAHKNCFDRQKAYELTDEYKIEVAQRELQDATNRYNVAANHLLTAKNKLAQLTGVSADVIE